MCIRDRRWIDFNDVPSFLDLNGMYMEGQLLTPDQMPLSSSLSPLMWNSLSGGKVRAVKPLASQGLGNCVVAQSNSTTPFFPHRHPSLNMFVILPQNMDWPKVRIPFSSLAGPSTVSTLQGSCSVFRLRPLPWDFNLDNLST